MRALALVTLALLLCLPAAARAQDQTSRDGETDFMVTVKAKGGDFIGSSMGGAQIIIRDRRTGDILVSGIPYGDNKGEGRARLEFSLELLEPVPVTISVTGPLAQPQSLVTTTFDTILIPGKDYTTNDGITVEIPGFAVNIVSPVPGEKIKFDPGKPLTLIANVIKMCGCQIEKGSEWPPENYQVEAHIYKGAAMVTTVPLTYSGKAGLFSKDIKLPTAGDYRFTITAFDPKTREAGMDTTGITLTP